MKKTIMRIRKFVLILIGVTLILNISTIKNVNAQSLDDPSSVIFETLGRENGLSNMSVSSIVQDKYGFMWFGTQGGLNMYNSSEVEMYSHNPFSKEGLLNNLIQTMYYDEVKHVLWIGTYQGLSRFDINTSKFKNYTVNDDGISNEIIVSIAKDSNGNIWFGTLNGLNKLDINKDTISTYEVPGEVIRDLLFDSNGNLLIATYEGLCKFNYQTEKVEKIDISLPSKYVMVIDEYKEGILTLGMWSGGVINIDINSFTIKDVIIENENVYSMMYSSDNFLYIGTWGNGLFVSKDSVLLYHFENSSGDFKLTHPIIYSLFEDESGLIWIGTNGGGISLLNTQKSNKVIHNHDEDDLNSLELGKINKLLISDNLRYYAVYNEGLNVYDPILDQMIYYKNKEGDDSSLGNNNINTIIEYDSNTLLMGTNSGIEIFDKTTKQFSKSQILPDSHIIYALFKDGDNLWIGTYQNGVFLYNIRDNTLFELSDLIDDSNLDNLINCIYVDSKDRIWIGSNNGLSMLIRVNKSYTINTFYNEGYDYNQLGSNIIKEIFEDHNNDIWIGTNGGGISKYNEDGTFKTYTTLNSLSSNIVTGINQDSAGYIWIATQDGISKLNINTDLFTNYDLDDGIGGYDFTSNVLYDSGQLYFGGNHGIVSISEKYSSVGTFTPQVYITEVNVLQKPISNDIHVFNDEYFKLSYNENDIGFKFNTLNYQKSNSNRVKYKLIGFDNGYIDADSSTYVHYSRLPAGDYTFEVISYVLNSDEQETALVHFTITKPWYLTNIAYFAYIVVLLGFGFMVFRLYEARKFKSTNEQLRNLNSKLELQTIKDPLTNAFNRRYFESNFQDLIDISIRSSLPISVMILDIDDFKLINDLRGHLTGDEVLKELTVRINSVLKRSTDFVSRIGGDEFIIVMFDTDSAGAITLSNKIKKSIEDSPYGEDLKLTISAGVVSLIPSSKDNANSIFEMVDKQLYNAKSKGKNQINFY